MRRHYPRMGVNERARRKEAAAALASLPRTLIPLCCSKGEKGRRDQSHITSALRGKGSNFQIFSTWVVQGSWQCMFGFEICVSEGSCGEKRGNAHFKTKLTELLTSELTTVCVYTFFGRWGVSVKELKQFETSYVNGPKGRVKKYCSISTTC